MGSQTATESISCGINGNYNVTRRWGSFVRLDSRRRLPPHWGPNPWRRSVKDSFMRFCAVHDALRFLLGHDVQAHQVRGTAGLARAGDDAEYVFGPEHAAADQVLLGHDDHLLSGARLRTADRMHAPIQIHAVHNRGDVGKRIDRRLWAVFGDHAGGVAGFSEDRKSTR